MPRISIIIPVYNVAPYLRECLDSIQAQTFKDFEALLIDDGSTDGSGQMCDWYAAHSKRFKVIHKSNGGVSSARNTGLDMAQGDCIGFMDPDDYISPTFYEELLKPFDDGADISISCVKIISEHGRPIWPPLPTKAEYTGGQVLAGFYSGLIYGFLVDKLYSRSLFDGIRCDEDISILEDNILMPYILSKAQKAIEVPEAEYFYRRRPGSLTATKFDLARVGHVFEACKRIEQAAERVTPGALEEIEPLTSYFKASAVIALFRK